MATRACQRDRVRRRAVFGAGLLALASLLGCTEPRRLPPPVLPEIAALSRPVRYEEEVRPVLEARCVVCHACYDAPCQLQLSSREGAERGASKLLVYDGARLRESAPTRLFVDAPDAAAWRTKGFFPVSKGTGTQEPSRWRDSLMVEMLALGRALPLPSGERLPTSVDLDINRDLSCPAPGNFGDYASRHPFGGMPYATAPLSTRELRLLASWVAQGLPGSDAKALPPTAHEQVRTWEAFLNGESLKERIAARYLYEHWFLAHLYFENLPVGPFFRVVRSSTAPGETVREIATRRPYDDPGSEPFWYRLRPIETSIVHKTHIVYRLGPDRLARLRALFLESDWDPTRLPGYAPEEAANPFVAFDQIPARSRYQYLLDDAQYFVMTFIRGPVCHGQIAVDVIQDHFFVAFLDPDYDLSVREPTLLAEARPLLDLPAEHGSNLLPGQVWLGYSRKQAHYLNLRERYYAAADPDGLGPSLAWIWDGEGSNPNALLTVFRHYDNATVLRGFQGGTPKTAWIIDYPIFERIYYDLVAGFDAFGNVSHQAATRLYMDHLRMQSENNFLAFLPRERRKPIRASWYVGATRQPEYLIADRLRSLQRGTQVPFDTQDVVAELLVEIEAHNSGVAGPPDRLNGCRGKRCSGLEPPSAVETQLRGIAGGRGLFAAPLPEVSLLVVRGAGHGGSDLVYSMIHNRAHTNVAHMLRESARLVPAEDTLSILPGHVGSYPNFAFVVEAAELPAFVAEVRALGAGTGFSSLVARYGLRRTDARFWETLDWLDADRRRREPTTAGLYDIGRYEDP